MDAQQIGVMLVIGAVAGWLAGLMIRGGGFGLIGNVIVGILGAVVGSYLFKALNVHVGTGIGAALVSAVTGAVVLLFIIGLIKRR